MDWVIEVWKYILLFCTQSMGWSIQSCFIFATYQSSWWAGLTIYTKGSSLQLDVSATTRDGKIWVSMSIWKPKSDVKLRRRGFFGRRCRRRRQCCKTGVLGLGGNIENSNVWFHTWEPRDYIISNLRFNTITLISRDNGARLRQNGEDDNFGHGRDDGEVWCFYTYGSASNIRRWKIWEE